MRLTEFTHSGRLQLSLERKKKKSAFRMTAAVTNQCQWQGTNCTKHLTQSNNNKIWPKNTNTCMQTNSNVFTLTWDNFTAHGDWLEGFSRRLGRARWLTLWDNLTARCDWLESRVTVGTQSDPVTAFGASWRALTSSHTASVAVCRSSRLWFNKTWKSRFSFIGIVYRLCGWWKKKIKLP